MSILFRKTIKIFPGVKINIGKTGISTSVGVRGAHVTVGKRGARVTAGLPGTGLSVTKKIGGKGKKAAAQKEPQAEPAQKLSPEEINMRVRTGDGKKLFYRAIASIIAGGIVWYAISFPIGIGAAVGLFFVLCQKLIKEISQRPLPAAFKTKEAAILGLVDVLNAVNVQKIKNQK